jgi:flagellar P-ring protein FlgI
MMTRLLSAALFLAALGGVAHAQELAVRDLVIADQAVPVRLMGYGIVVGLPGTGDRASTHGSVETVQSIANILRRFNVQVPAEWLTTRNAAAVLVTADVSPYLRPGGQFDVEVSSIGDARSLRGGTLWMTPLVADVGGQPLASAQGSLLLSTGEAPRLGAWSMAWDGGRSNAPETSARIPAGGLVEAQLPRAAVPPAGPLRLMLRRPDATTATRIAAAINKTLGDSAATVDDPGQVTVSFSGADADRTALIARVAAVKVAPGRSSRIVIDARSGAVVAGGDIVVGEGVVTTGDLALRIGGASSDTTKQQGQVDLPAGCSVQALVAALHAVQTSPGQIAAVFEALRDVGAISADLVIQ